MNKSTNIYYYYIYTTGHYSIYNSLLFVYKVIDNKTAIKIYPEYISKALPLYLSIEELKKYNKLVITGELNPNYKTLKSDYQRCNICNNKPSFRYWKIEKDKVLFTPWLCNKHNIYSCNWIYKGDPK
jgi:hypothetical protein